METTQTTIPIQGVTLDESTMKDVLAKYDLGFPKEGEVVSGKIISVSKNGVLVDLDFLGTGIIYPSEFYDNPNLHKLLKEEEDISAILLNLENDEGYRELSLRQVQKTSAWEDIREKKVKEEVVSVTILNINKGGLIIEINGIQGFLPLSQLSGEHYPKVEGGDTTKIVQALQKFRGQIFNVKILDFSEEEDKLIVSEKAIISDRAKEELAKFKVGDIVEGIVDVVTDFGAFIKVAEGIDGLIHISEIDWKIVENPRDYLKVGEKITAKIVNIENNRISLSLKALKTDPWEKVEGQFAVGQTLEGEIAKITTYGLLVKISEEIVGLIPANEMNNKKDWSPKRGENVQVAIVSIEPKEHKMLLTINPRSDLPESPRSDLESLKRSDLDLNKEIEKENEKTKKE